MLLTVIIGTAEENFSSATSVTFTALRNAGSVPGQRSQHETVDFLSDSLLFQFARRALDLLAFDRCAFGRLLMCDLPYPQKSNERVEELAHALAKAFEEQFGGEIVGHLHVFMQQGEINTPDGVEKVCHTVVLHYIPEEVDTDYNMLKLIRDISDWMTKREVDE